MIKEKTMKNKYVKMEIQNYNKIGELLNKLEIRAGIDNALRTVQMFELLKKIEIVEEKVEVKDE